MRAKTALQEDDNYEDETNEEIERFRKQQEEDVDDAPFQPSSFDTLENILANRKRAPGPHADRPVDKKLKTSNLNDPQPVSTFIFTRSPVLTFKSFSHLELSDEIPVGDSHLEHEERQEDTHSIDHVRSEHMLEDLSAEINSHLERSSDPSVYTSTPTKFIPGVSRPLSQTGQIPPVYDKEEDGSVDEEEEEEDESEDEPSEQDEDSDVIEIISDDENEPSDVSANGHDESRPQLQNTQHPSFSEEPEEFSDEDDDQNQQSSENEASESYTKHDMLDGPEDYVSDDNSSEEEDSEIEEISGSQSVPEDDELEVEEDESESEAAEDSANNNQETAPLSNGAESAYPEQVSSTDFSQLQDLAELSYIAQQSFTDFPPADSKITELSSTHTPLQTHGQGIDPQLGTNASVNLFENDLEVQNQINSALATLADSAELLNADTTPFHSLKTNETPNTPLPSTHFEIGPSTVRSKVEQTSELNLHESKPEAPLGISVNGTPLKPLTVKQDEMHFKSADTSVTFTFGQSFVKESEEERKEPFNVEETSVLGDLAPSENEMVASEVIDEQMEELEQNASVGDEQEELQEEVPKVPIPLGESLEFPTNASASTSSVGYSFGSTFYNWPERPVTAPGSSLTTESIQSTPMFGSFGATVWNSLNARLDGPTPTSSHEIPTTNVSSGRPKLLRTKSMPSYKVHVPSQENSPELPETVPPGSAQISAESHSVTPLPSHIVATTEGIESRILDKVSSDGNSAEENSKENSEESSSSEQGSEEEEEEYFMEQPVLSGDAQLFNASDIEELESDDVEEVYEINENDEIEGPMAPLQSHHLAEFTSGDEVAPEANSGMGLHETQPSESEDESDEVSHPMVDDEAEEASSSEESDGHSRLIHINQSKDIEMVDYPLDGENMDSDDESDSEASSENVSRSNSDEQSDGESGRSSDVDSEERGTAAVPYHPVSNFSELVDPVLAGIQEHDGPENVDQSDSDDSVIFLDQTQPSQNFEDDEVSASEASDSGSDDQSDSEDDSTSNAGSLVSQQQSENESDSRNGENSPAEFIEEAQELPETNSRSQDASSSQYDGVDIPGEF